MKRLQLPLFRASILVLGFIVALAAPSAVSGIESSQGDCAPSYERLVESFTNRGWLGLRLLSASRDEGFRVVRLEPGGPGATSGLRHGDLVVSIGGQSTVGTDLATIDRFLESLEPGQTVEIVVRRGSERETLSLRSRPMPPDVAARALGVYVIQTYGPDIEGEFFEGPPGRSP